MFQSIAQQPQTASRHAEQGDARMALQRREEDEGRRKGSRGRRSKEVLSNDDTSVSVESLKVFVDNLLRAHESRAEREAALIAAEPQDTLIKTAPKANIASPSALAAKAYASASRTARRTPAMETAHVIPAQNPMATSGTRLSASERSEIAKIQGNLSLMMERGIETLTIQRGETFLGSLLQSSEAALNG